MTRSPETHVERSDDSPVVALQQTAIGDYRQQIMTALREAWGARFLVYTGMEYFEPTTQTQIDVPGGYNEVHNRFLLGRRLEWQPGVVQPLVKADVAIVEFNPRVLSVWPILLVRRALRKRTVLWGHAWSRSGKASRTERVRALMRRLCDVVMVYTEQQRAELIEEDPRRPVVVAPNAIYRKSEMGPASKSGASDFLFVGRLVPTKKPVLALQGFLHAVREGLPSDVRLVFAGEGPERAALERAIAEVDAHDAHDRIVLLGHVPPSAMRQHFAGAIASLSPGYVGLSVTQSLSFGIPMIVARDEPHSPEFEAIQEGANARIVASDDPAALGDMMRLFAAERDVWHARAESISRDCAQRYSVEAMLAGVREAVGA